MRIPFIGELHRKQPDHWGAYELPLGVALFLRLGIAPLLGANVWVALAVSLVLLGLAGWWGWRREQTLLGRDEPSGVRSLAFWQALAVATALTVGAWYLTNRQGLAISWRWQPLAMLLGLWLGAFWLTLGVLANRARHVYLGLWLCAVAALLPMARGDWPRAILGAIGLGGAMALLGWRDGRKR